MTDCVMKTVWRLSSLEALGPYILILPPRGALLTMFRARWESIPIQSCDC